MAYKKKPIATVTEHPNGDVTYSKSNGVGFYNPFILLKKDFKIEKNLIHDSIRSVVFIVQLLQSINSDNRVFTTQLNSIGKELGFSTMTVSRLAKNLVTASFLIKINHGLYKVNESLVIFKQDQEGYLALQSETKALQVINNYNTQNIQIVQEEGKSLKDTLISAREKSFNNL